MTLNFLAVLICILASILSKLAVVIFAELAGNRWRVGLKGTLIVVCVCSLVIVDGDFRPVLIHE